jgi:hypothetical protein
MSNEPPNAALRKDGREDLVRNLSQYESHWRSRFRKTWNYSSQGKLRRFRHLMRETGLLSRKNLSVFDQGFGLG